VIAGNFKLALEGKVINWLNHIKDTEQIDISLWSRIEPQFKSHYDIQIQTVDNVWNFSKLNHEERDDPAGLKLKVSKLINNISSTAPDYHIEIKEAYTFAEVQQITLEATRNLKTHMMKTLFINKLASTYKDLICSTLQLIWPEHCGSENIRLDLYCLKLFFFIKFSDYDLYLHL
jgi:hypothetical protein